MGDKFYIIQEVQVIPRKPVVSETVHINYGNWNNISYKSFGTDTYKKEEPKFISCKLNIFLFIIGICPLLFTFFHFIPLMSADLESTADMTSLYRTKYEPMNECHAMVYERNRIPTTFDYYFIYGVKQNNTFFLWKDVFPLDTSFGQSYSRAEQISLFNNIQILQSIIFCLNALAILIHIIAILKRKIFLLIILILLYLALWLLQLISGCLLTGLPSAIRIDFNNYCDDRNNIYDKFIKLMII